MCETLRVVIMGKHANQPEAATHVDHRNPLIRKTLETAIQHQAAGRREQAQALFQQVLEQSPDHPVALCRLGVMAFVSGDREEAINLVGRAVTVAPDFAKAHENLAIMYQSTGKLFDAENSFRAVLALQPDNAEAHNNVGFVLLKQGKPVEALESLQRAIAIAPDYLIAHYNLGNAFHTCGRIDEAIASYRAVITLDGSFAAAHYSLHALLLDPGDMTPAINCVRRALECEPASAQYRFVLGMLLDYAGSHEEAATHMGAIDQAAKPVLANRDAWDHIRSYGEPLPHITGSAIAAFRIAADAANTTGQVLEFGVRFGNSIRQIAGLVGQDVHGFDSFEGLPEAWHNEPGGAYTTGGVMPAVPDNVTLHKGWFDDMLPEFVAQHPEPVRLLNIDCDIYSSTITILDTLAPQIVPGTVMVFDEYIGGESWRDDEFRAFTEMAAKHGWQHEILCFSFLTGQVVIRIK